MKVSIAPATMQCSFQLHWTLHRCQCPPIQPWSQVLPVPWQLRHHSLLCPLTSVGPTVLSPCLYRPQSLLPAGPPPHPASRSCLLGPNTSNVM